MRVATLAAALASLLLAASVSSAQVLSLEFHDGRVRLTAENVPVSRILAEWSRVGGTRIVNGERIPGGPVSLQLVDTPERQAIDIVLRAAAGYMVGARDAPAAPGLSVFDRILVLPTTARAPSAPTPTVPPPVTFEPEEPVEADTPDAAPPGPTRLPPGSINRVPLNRPPVDARPDGDEQGTGPQVPAPANPFGVPAGSARPGTITPVAPPRNPGEPQPR